MNFLCAALNLSDVSDRQVQLEEIALILHCLVDQMVLRRTQTLSLTHQCIQQSLCPGLVYVHCRFLARASHVAFFRHTVGGSYSQQTGAIMWHQVSFQKVRQREGERGGWFVLDMQLVRREPLSEDALSLVPTDSRDSSAAKLGYNQICL